MQASLASDFAINEFKAVEDLITWHGRNSYSRTAKLGNFVFHRGLIISVIQAIFIGMFYFAAIPIYNGWLMLGYTTFYTSLPVLSLVLDKDVDRQTVKKFPILYR
jgi:phospholipid-translocating ATPase